MKDRHILILKKLYYSSVPLTTQELCSEFSVSLRTIRYDLNSIKRLLNNRTCKLINKNGFFVRNSDKHILLELLNENDVDNSTLKIEKQNEIITMLALNNNTMNANKISEKIYISESTVFKYIQELESEDFNIEQKNKHYYLRGNEYIIRKILVKNISRDLNKNATINDYYLGLPILLREKINEIEFHDILHLLNRINEEYNVWLSQVAYTQLLIYLIVSFIRIKNKNEIIDFGLIDNEIFNVEIKYSKQLLETMYKKTVSVGEINAFIKYFISTGVFIGNKENNDGKASKLVKEIINYIGKNNEKIDLLSLKDDLINHISLSIKREQMGYEFSENPLLNQIKSQYTQYYNFAIEIKDKIITNSVYAYKVDENELGYLAIYLYKNTKENFGEKKAKIVLVCASGRGVSKLLETRIHHVFPQLEIVETLSVHKIKNSVLENIDFIISTIPLENIKVPVIYITQLLNIKDIQLINRMLNYGIDSKIIPNTSKPAIEEFLNKQFSTINKDTFVSVEGLSKVILSLVDTLMVLSNKYSISEQKILGILIHLIIAIPRWLNNKYGEVDDNIKDEISNIFLNHRELYNSFNKIFEQIENEFSIVLNDSERLNFFDYIIER